jgi:predicted DsbA family dithiol-disulfide isomerase
LSCHQFLHAVHCTSGQEAMEACAWELRMSFFARAEPVGLRKTQLEIAEGQKISRAKIEKCLDSGEALAELSGQARLAAERAIKVSPTLVLDDGRQTLKGNVGYKVIEANVQELLDKGRAELSWC